MAFPQDVQFADVTKSAGITFTHNSGRAGKRWLPETMGSGCAFIDADGDGWPDIVLVNSKDWTPRGRRSVQDRRSMAVGNTRRGVRVACSPYPINRA